MLLLAILAMLASSICYLPIKIILKEKKNARINNGNVSRKKIKEFVAALIYNQT